MLFYNHIRKLITGFYRLIKYAIHKITDKRYKSCCIEEIDIAKKTIIIHCRGVNAPIKLCFEDIITDFVILSNLSSIHASWIGYYYGKYYNDQTCEKYLCNNSLNFYFPMNSSAGNLNIIMLNRYGDLIYSDKNNNTCTISPINAMTNKNLIIKFDSIQACYIGILAGIASSKSTAKSYSRTNSKKTQLKLVK